MCGPNKLFIRMLLIGILFLPKLIKPFPLAIKCNQIRIIQNIILTLYKGENLNFSENLNKLVG